MTYSNVRPETHHARDFIIQELHKLPTIERVWDDGTDLVVGTFQSGQRVMFYLVDYYMSLHEIQKTLENHQQKGFHTLFLFWADMLLPNDGERYIPDSWMQALLSLYGDKIYGYDVSSTDVFIFPVHFRPQPPHPDRFIRWGKTIRMQDLRTDTIHIESVHLKGQFRIADFARRVRSSTSEESTSQGTFSFAVRTPLGAYYDLLNIQPDATPEVVRRAYRELARQYHPDLNPSPDATAKMQAINQAYQQIMDQFEE
jgi:hypothetical protein